MSPPCGWCGLKSFPADFVPKQGSHHLAGGVDWNGFAKRGMIPYGCHHLAGGVDWNSLVVKNTRIITVTTLRVVWIEIIIARSHTKSFIVTTLRVVWIEIVYTATVTGTNNVTTLRVVWIEINYFLSLNECCQSPPCGWCGLKFPSYQAYKRQFCHHLAGGVDWNLQVIMLEIRIRVTTLRVVWIEILTIVMESLPQMVTTLRVVWIEISPIGRCWYC